MTLKNEEVKPVVYVLWRLFAGAGKVIVETLVLPFIATSIIDFS